MEKIGKIIKVSAVVKKGEGYVQDIVLFQEEKRQGEKKLQTEEFWPFSIYSKDQHDSKFMVDSPTLRQRYMRISYYERGVKYEKEGVVKFFINFSLQRWEQI